MKKACVIIVLSLVSFLLAWRSGFEREANAQDLIGAWRAQVSTPLGLCASETLLMPNGQFTKTFICGALTTWDTGTYTIGQGYIHFNIIDHEPKVYKGKPMAWQRSETVFFQLSGSDRMICADRITGGSWEAVRVR